MPIETIETIIQQDIPRNILPPAYEFDKSEALGTLKAFGFIKERHGGASYDIHRFGETKDLPWNLLHKLGVCSHMQGKYAEAEALQRQTLQLKETVLRKDHPITLGSMMNLATSLSQQGKVASPAGQGRRGPGDGPADAAALGDRAWEGPPGAGSLLMSATFDRRRVEGKLELPVLGEPPILPLVLQIKLSKNSTTPNLPSTVPTNKDKEIEE
ncbi:hypothetical protein V500_04691, partial [Pseudogymnoascus sp. VKM F-4518 (FW-2643)]